MQARRSPGAERSPFQFSLHVRHPCADPDEISSRLQLSAVESFKAGTPRASRSGIAAAALHPETYWVAMIYPETWALPSLLAAFPPGQDEAITATLKDLRRGALGLGWGLWATCARLHRRHGDYVRGLASQGGSVTLLVAHSPHALAGLRLLPDMARQIAELDLTIKFEPLESGQLN